MPSKKLQIKKKVKAKQSKYADNKFDVNPQNVFKIPNDNEVMKSQIPLEHMKKKCNRDGLLFI